MKESKYQLGLVSVSFRQHSPKEILEVTRSAGIEWGSDVHAPCRDIERLREIAALQKEYGIVCSSYGTYFRLGETPIEELETYIQAAKILGTDLLRLWCGVKSGKDMTKEERNPDDAVWLMETVNSPHFRMYWQPFQWQNVDENIINAKKIAPYAEHIHVFNWRGKEKLPLGESVEEWQSYLKQFAKPRTLLLEFMPDNETSTLSREADALRAIIGG